MNLVVKKTKMTNKQTLREKLLEVQKEIGAIKRDSENPYFKSKYFDINALLSEVKPVLNKHGLILTQALCTIEGKLGLETSIIDSEGIDAISSKCPISENPDPQKQGSAITYFRRYALQSLLGLEAEDDDGNGASQSKNPVKRNIEPSKPIYPSEAAIDLPEEDPFNL